MTTIREHILDDIVSSLAGTANVGTRIYRSRVTPLARGESPALVVEPIRDAPDLTGIASIALDHQLTVRVAVIVRGDKPDELADPIVESLHSRIMADETLGGYAINTTPGETTFEMIDADQPAGVISCEYLIHYRTTLRDLAAQP
tara:strand:- start:2224 stop:2658 length:435 start_codon:yes stop_codon:yes gene_type:complete